MILSAHQPSYLPWPGWYDKVRQSDIFVILDQVQYEKGSFVNRTDIMVKGKPVRLTIPVMNGHFGDLISEKTIIHDGWDEKHIATIRMAYSQSPFYTKYVVSVATYISTLKDIKTLGELEPWIPGFYKSRIVKQSAIVVTGKKLDLIVNLCHHFGADQFLFGELGRDYCDEGYLRSKGIEPLFQQYDGPKVSIIDYLFNGRAW